MMTKMMRDRNVCVCCANERCGPKMRLVMCALCGRLVECGGHFIKGKSDLRSRRGPKRPPRGVTERARRHVTVMLATSLDAATLCPATCGHPPQYHPPQFGSPERKACATLCHSFHASRSYLSAIYPRSACGLDGGRGRRAVSFAALLLRPRLLV